MTLNMLATYILADNGGFELSNLLKSATGKVNDYAQSLVVIIGVVMVVAAIYQIGKGFMSGGRGQTNWAMAIGCLIVGGAICVTGGYKLIADVAKGGKDTINSMGANSGASKVTMDKSAESDSTIIIGDYIYSFDE